MQKDFYINDQFLVKPASNLVIDGLISKISRVDPEIMQLLCLLAQKNREPVASEELITRIWQDQPGMNEQLEQNITALRKLLQDEKKELIRNVSKKGYLLHAQLANADIDDLREEAKRPAYRAATSHTTQKWIVILSILIVLLLIIFVAFNYTYSSPPAQIPGNNAS